MAAVHEFFATAEDPTIEFERKCAEQIATLEEWKNDTSEEKRIWMAVFNPPTMEGLPVLQEHIRQHPTCMHILGPLGAMAVHLCFVIGSPVHLALGKFMIDYDDEMRAAKRPPHPERLIDRFYRSREGEEESPFDGENLLHIAVVKKDLEMAKWLLQRSHRLLVGFVRGAFFNPGMRCYYGSTPLHFAVATGQQEMANLFLEEAPRLKELMSELSPPPGVSATMLDRRAQVQRLLYLDMLDNWGNNVMHVLVHQEEDDRQLVMHDWLKAKEAELRREYRKAVGVVHAHSLEQVTNEDRMTPFVLSADAGKVKVFEHILRCSAITNWTYGPLVCMSYPLDGLDEPPRHAVETLGADVEVESALSCILAKDGDEYLEFLRLPLVQKLISKRWNSLARRIFYIRMFVQMFFAVVLGAVIYSENMLMSDAELADPISPAQARTFERIALGGKLVFAVFCLLQFIKDMRVIMAEGLPAYLEESGSARLENVANWSLFGTVIATGLAELMGASEEVRCALMAAVSLIYGVYMLFFFLGFELTGPFLVTIWDMITNDIARFAFAIILTFVGFATAFHAVFRQSTVLSYVITLRDTLLLNFGVADSAQFFDDVHAPWFTTTLMIIYIMIITVLLMNLLIATMGQTYADTQENNNIVWLRERARITQAIVSEFAPRPTKDFVILQVPPPDPGLPDDAQASQPQRYMISLAIGDNANRGLSVEEMRKIQLQRQETELAAGSGSMRCVVKSSSTVIKSGSMAKP